MRSAIAALVVGFSLFGTRAVSAAPFTASLDPLRTELETRRDNDFGGTLDSTQKKQKAVVLKCLTLIDKDSTSIQGDIKTFAGVSKLLEKAYPGEMNSINGLPLFLLAFDAVGALSDDFNNDLANLALQVAKMVPSKPGAKAAKLLVAANRALTKPNPEFLLSLFAKGNLKAWHLVLKGLPLVEGAEILPAPGMDFLADSLPHTANTVSWYYHSKSKRIALSAYTTDLATGDSASIHVSGIVVPGDLEITIDSGFYEVYTADPGNTEIYEQSGGFISIDTLDLPGHLFTGTLDMQVTGSTDFEVSGTFTASWYLEVVND